jgi:hypothetical protein
MLVKMGMQCGITSAIIDLKEACSSVRRQDLYNILFEFGIFMHLVKGKVLPRTGHEGPEGE